MLSRRDPRDLRAKASGRASIDRLGFLLAGVFLTGILGSSAFVPATEITAKKGAPHSRVPPDAAPSPASVRSDDLDLSGDPDDSPLSPLWRELLAKDLQRRARLRIHDFGRSIQLGLDRADELEDLVESLAWDRARVPKTESEGMRRRGALLEEIWEDPRFTKWCADRLTPQECVVFAERGSGRIARVRRAEAELAAARLVERLRLDPE